LIRFGEWAVCGHSTLDSKEILMGFDFIELGLKFSFLLGYIESNSFIEFRDFTD
jgi:hypothetical protein